ncbi:uncharacterized protein [Montipora foliosa]|uniref:uncharacterized protein n=1 Tax=Montipora foliosa TaxID=591990 RepID=UPI0035F13DC0
MSDTENGTESILDVPHGGSFSLRQESISLPPSSVPVEHSSVSTDLASTFALFKDYFDKKLTASKRDIQEDSLSNSDSIAKKLKEDSKISFKFEGNKKQFYFNSGLAKMVQSASTALGKRKFEVVRGYLEELDSDIKKRNKLIRLADKSAAGWDLVNEYLSDELASGSEDEKRIRRAEQRALRKRKDRQQQKVKSSVKQSQPSATTTSFAGQPHFNFRSSSRSFTPSGKAKPGDICFACGQQGHWKSQCRANSQFRSSSSGQSNSGFPSNVGDFVSGILQSCFQHVEHTRLKGLIQGLPAVLLKSKAGGASAAADAQVSDRLFKRHGRWKSDKAKDDYIKDNILSLLSVSLSLGI